MTRINYNLMLASGGNDLQRVEYLIEAGASARVRTWVMNEGPLFRAAACGTGDICSALINAGADVNAVDANGETPLHWAVYSGNRDTVQALINAGASLTAGECSVRVMAYKVMMRAHARLVKDMDFYGPVLDHPRGGRQGREAVAMRRKEASTRAEILEILRRQR